MPADPPPPEDLVLRQLQGIRREFAAVLENQRRDRELILRLDRHFEDRIENLTRRVDEGFESLRRELREVRSDIVLLENGMLTRQNEILAVVRRLDESGLARSEEPEIAGPGLP